MMTQPATPAASSTSGVVILLVDDDPDCRLLVRDALELGGIYNPVYEVSDGIQALEFLARSQHDPATPRPGLIYLDVEMPGINGLEVLRQIREHPHWNDIPVVMLTGVADDQAKRTAMAFGANSYTLKPHDIKVFTQSVQTATQYWTKIHQRPSTPGNPNAQTTDTVKS